MFDSEGLKFTAEIWRPTKEERKTTKQYDRSTTVITAKCFPFLDMELYWNDEDKLEFRVHMKENKVLQYPNLHSCHTNNCFTATLSKIFNRLTKFILNTLINLETKLDILYPDHVKV